MKVSIIIPVYKVEKYIIRCLESVKAQTFTDYEVILVDDCGGDNSIALAESYCEQYFPNNHKIIHHDHNKGLSEARNTGVRNCSGEFIYFLDSDDEITNHCLEVLVNAITEKTDFAIARYQNQPPLNWKFADTQIADRNCTVDLYIKRQLPWNAVNRLIRKCFIIDNNLFFTKGITSEDLLWNFECLTFINEISIVNKITYIYYNNANSIMSNANYNYKYAYDLTLILEKMSHIAINSDNNSIKSYFTDLKYKFFIDAILWHSYPYKFKKNMLLENLKTRFDVFYKYLPFSIKILFLLPKRCIVDSILFNYHLHNYTEAIKSKLRHLHNR